MKLIIVANLIGAVIGCALGFYHASRRIKKENERVHNMTRKELEKIMMDLSDIAKHLKEEDKTNVYKITLDNMEKRLKEAGVEIE